MSRSCPTCGSTVGEGVTICPVCGEALTGDTVAVVAATPADETSTDAAPGASAAPVTPARSGGSGGKPVYCTECGAKNLPDAIFCSTCGTRLAAPAKGSAKTPKQPAGTRRSATVDYLIALVAAMVIGGVVLLVFTPEEHAGPPQTAEDQAAAGATGSGMPPGHPSTTQAPTATPEQLQQIAELEKQVAARPDDLDSKLKLANIYNDLERHTEAVPLYKAYLDKHPGDADARTNMAYSIANNGGLDTAIAELSRVMRDNPKHQIAAYDLATMYVAKRDRDSTLYWLQRVVAIDSTTQAGHQAAEILGQVAQGNAPSDQAPAGRQ
jgi:hypothetical protein